MIVQKVEFFTPQNAWLLLRLHSSARPKSCIVSVLLRFYVVVIYIYHFESIRIMPAIIALWLLTIIGIMTNSEMSDIRYLSPYPL